VGEFSEAFEPPSSGSAVGLVMVGGSVGSLVVAGGSVVWAAW
jgi:hypothetical protein